MAGYKDYSTAFVRTLVVKTPPHQRDTGRRAIVSGTPACQRLARWTQLLDAIVECVGDIEVAG